MFDSLTNTKYLEWKMKNIEIGKWKMSCLTSTKFGIQNIVFDKHQVWVFQRIHCTLTIRICIPSHKPCPSSLILKKLGSYWLFDKQEMSIFDEHKNLEIEKYHI